jgi:hypothetical protein
MGHWYRELMKEECGHYGCHKTATYEVYGPHGKDGHVYCAACAKERIAQAKRTEEALEERND